MNDRLTDTLTRKSISYQNLANMRSWKESDAFKVATFTDVCVTDWQLLPQSHTNFRKFDLVRSM